MDALQSNLKKHRELSLKTDFWSNNAKASGTLKQISRIEKEIELWQNLNLLNDDIEVLFEFGDAGESTSEEVSAELKKIYYPRRRS